MPAGPDNVRYFQIRSTDRQGNAELLQIASGQGTVENYPTLYDAFGNLIGKRPRGSETGTVQMADEQVDAATGLVVPGAYTAGDLVIFDKRGRVVDAGFGPAPAGGGSGSGYGSPYWQVPLGIMNRQNADFFLDYIPLTFVNIKGETKVWIELYVNGVLQNNEFHYLISPGTNRVLMRFPPKASDLPMLAFYFRGAPAHTPPPPGTVPPPPPVPPPTPPATGIANIDLTVVTAWTQDQNAISGAAISVNGSRSFATTGLIQNTAPTYPKQSSTINIYPTQASWLTGDVTTLTDAEAIKIWFFSFSGGAPGTSLSPQADFKIYDAYLTLTYPDNSTVVLRPSRAIFELNDGSGSMVEVPPTIQDSNAVDNDVNTWAELLTSAWGPFGTPPALRIEGFASNVVVTPKPATLNIWCDVSDSLGSVIGTPAVSYSLDGGITWVGGDGTLSSDAGVQV